MNKTVGFIILSLFNTAALAASVPNTFSAGAIASADEVNANFAALVAAVTALEAKVNPATMADLAGTYNYFEVIIDVDNLSATSNSMAGSATSGTVVLNADGSGTASTSTTYRQQTFNAVTTGDNTVAVDFFNTPSTSNNAISWSLSNGVVTISGGGSFTVVGQLLINSIKNVEGQNGLVILARSQ